MTWGWTEKRFAEELQGALAVALMHSVSPIEIESIKGDTVTFAAGGPEEGYWSEPPTEAARFEVTIRKVE
jgi:hypothetical protein